MGGIVLARKWRPQTFEEVIGQEPITRTLTNAISSGRIAHAYLFSGMRGVGKTTVARILARALNCVAGPTPVPCGRCDPCMEVPQGISVDVVEIDGASQSSVEDVRGLRETVRYLPMKGRYKVYIIDEVHRLSGSAFDALLKTVEEPPPHLVFVFATTEAHKIPLTVLSRCQHFAFRRVPVREIIARLATIARAEGIRVSEASLRVIARSAEGSMRDALSLLDQAAAYGGGEVREEDVLLLSGQVNSETLSALMAALREKDPRKVLAIASDLQDEGVDLRGFCLELLGHIRNMLVAKIVKPPDQAIDLPEEVLTDIVREAEHFSLEDLQRLFSLFSRAYEEMKGFFSPGLLLEMTLVKATQFARLIPLEQILSEIRGLSHRLSSGGVENRPTGEADSPRLPEGQAAPGKRETSPPAGSVLSVRAAATGQRETGPALSPDLWERMIATLRERKPLIASCLERGTPLDLSGDEMTIGYEERSSLLIDLVEREESRRLIGEVAEEVFRKKVAVKIVPLPATPGLTIPQEEKEPAIVRQALQVFGGKVVEVREI